MRFTQWIIVAAISGCLVATDASSAELALPIYKDRGQPVDKRVDDLVARMSLEEKVAQLETVWENKAKLQTPSGSFSAEHGIRRLKLYMMPDWRGGAELDLMRRIKSALDPRGLLNPGKLLP